MTVARKAFQVASNSGTTPVSPKLALHVRSCDYSSNSYTEPISEALEHKGTKQLVEWEHPVSRQYTAHCPCGVVNKS